MSTIPLNLETDTVRLPTPVLPDAFTLAQALQRRRSTRSFSAEPLPLETLAALLWSACGINRPDTGGRTAPSAHNWQEIEVHAVLAEGAYRYDPRANLLVLVSVADLREATGTQDFVGSAPVNLVYVADFEKLADAREEDRGFLVGADAGCIAQNVSLYCACAGLATVVRGRVDRRRLAQELGLKPTQRITLAQSVGYGGPGA